MVLLLLRPSHRAPDPGRPAVHHRRPLCHPIQEHPQPGKLPISPFLPSVLLPCRIPPLLLLSLCVFLIFVVVISVFIFSFTIFHRLTSLPPSLFPSLPPSLHPSFLRWAASCTPLSPWPSTFFPCSSAPSTWPTSPMPPTLKPPLWRSLLPPTISSLHSLLLLVRLG